MPFIFSIKHFVVIETAAILDFAPFFLNHQGSYGYQNRSSKTIIQTIGTPVPKMSERCFFFLFFFLLLLFFCSSNTFLEKKIKFEIAKKKLFFFSFYIFLNEKKSKNLFHRLQTLKSSMSVQHTKIIIE